MIVWALVSVLMLTQGVSADEGSDLASEQWTQLRALTNQARRVVKDLEPNDPAIARTAQELIAAHRRFLQSFPEHTQAWSTLGRLAADINEMALADQAFSAAIALDRDDRGTRITWGTAWMHRDPARGIAMFDSFIETHPDDLVLHTNLLRALRLHDSDGIQQRWDRFTADPDGAVAAATMLHAMIAVDLPRAEALLPSLLAAKGDLPVVRTVQARVDRRQNHFGRARAAMEAMAPIDRSDPTRRYLYSDTCYAEGDYRPALEVLEAIDMESLGEDKPGLARRLKTLIPLRRRLAESWPAEQQQRLGDARLGHAPLIMLRIDGQEVICELHPDAAPNTVAAVLQLVESGFHDGRPTANVHFGFRSVFGEPDDLDAAVPWTLPPEFQRDEQRTHASGALSIFRSANDPNSGYSRFTIAHFPTPHLDGARTQFGRVISGIDVIRDMRGDETVDSIEILRRGTPVPMPMVLNADGALVPLHELSTAP